MNKNKHYWQKKKPYVSWKNQAKLNIFSSSAGVNGTLNTNRPIPLWPPPSLTTQTKPILRPLLFSVEIIITIGPKASPTSGNEVVSTWTCVERCWSEAKDCIIGLNKCKSTTITTTAMVVLAKDFTKAPPPKVGV